MGQQSMSPISVTGYTQDLIAESAPSSASTTASFDTYNLQNFYVTGYTGSSGGGLPTSGSFTSLFNSPTGGPTAFQLASYSASNALEFNLASQDTGAPYANTGTMTLTTPRAYTNIAFLSCATNAQTNKTDLFINYTLNFAGGISVPGQIAAQDWSENSIFSGFAIEGLGQVNQTGTIGTSLTLGMEEQDITVPTAYQGLRLNSISFSSAGTDFCWALYGISGLANGNASQGTLIWNGNVNSSMDTTTANFQGGVPFSNFYTAVFDDSAVGTTNVVVAPNLNPASMAFNNSSLAYNISGADLNAGGTLLIQGGGAVRISNNQSFGAASISNNSQLTVTSPGSLKASSLVASGGSLTVSNSSLAATGGYLELDGPNVSLTNSAVSATGAFNVNGGMLSMQGGNLSAGSMNIINAPMNVTGGAVTVSGATSLSNTATLSLQGTTFKSGSLILNPLTFMNVQGGSVTTSSLSVGNQSVFSIQGGGTIGGVSGAPLTLTGTGTVSLVGTSLSAGGSTNYSGNLIGTGGLNLSAGFITVGASNLQLTGPITVGNSSTSTAYLLIADGSGTAGQNSSGSPITVTVAGTGPVGPEGGYSGVIQGSPSAGSVFAGNIIITPGTVLSGGYGLLPSPAGTLTLTGAISGVGPVYFSSVGNSTTVLANSSNSYTGETRLLGTSASNSVYDIQTLQLGANNATSPASGISFSGTTSGLVFDLYGYNTTVAYLSGGNANSQVKSSSGNSTLTISTPGGTTANFSGGIASSVTVVKAGQGTQVFTTTNTYSGGTNVSGGILNPTISQALGSGPVVLGGGTLLLSTPAPQTSGFAGMLLNGSATLSGGNLQLTSGLKNQSGSAFTTSTVPITANGFTASFTYNGPTSGGGEGITFTIENSPGGDSALGGISGGLGYSGITKSVAVEFDIATSGLNGPTSKRRYGLGANGSVGTLTSVSTGNNYDPNNLVVTLSYNASGKVLTESTRTGDASPLTINQTYSVDLNSILGGGAGYVGFTGSTNASSSLSSIQTISNFSLNVPSLGDPVSISNAVMTAPGTSSTLSAAALPGLSNATIGALSIAPSSTLSIVNGNPGISTRLVLMMPSLSISGSTDHWMGKIDITNSVLDVQNGVLADLTNQVKAGYNGGTWQGSTGITSSNVAADPTHLMAVGVILNNANGNQLYGSGTTLGLIDGASPGSSDVLVKYTYYGDCNLDGKVDGSDYSLLDNGYQHQLSGWYNGDLNYDGVINGSDYTLIDNTFNTQGASLAAAVGSPTVQLAAEIAGVNTSSAVPEPSTISLLGVMAVGLLGRRFRSKATHV